MLEKAARAVFGEGLLLDSDECAAVVLAVLKAIREPDEAMMTAAAETPGMKAASSAMEIHQIRGYGFDPGAFTDGSPLEQAWRAAIDTITTEGAGE